MKYSFLASDNKRTKKYLEFFEKNNIKFNYILIYNVKRNIKYKFCNKVILFNEKFFNQKIKKKIHFLRLTNLIVSPSSGEIYKKHLMNNLNFYHCHPGKLPEFKGSCVIYYSILEKSSIHTTIFKMNNEIDRGKILYQEKFKIPNFKKVKYDDFDYEIRAKTFVKFLKRKKNIKYKFKIDSNLSFYRPHPILRILVENKIIFKRLNLLN